MHGQRASRKQDGETAGWHAKLHFESLSARTAVGAVDPECA